MQLRDHEEKLSQLNVKIVLVTFEGKDAARKYGDEMALSWPIIIDETRELYHGYGMYSASFWDIWGPRTWFGYFKEMLKGRKVEKTTADIRQRGGDILIDPNGTVQMHFVGEGPADRPDTALIFKIIAAWPGGQETLSL